MLDKKDMIHNMIHAGGGSMMRPSRARRVLGAFAVVALLTAGYAGMQLAPTIHATVSAASHGQLAIGCPSSEAHCMISFR